LFLNLFLIVSGAIHIQDLQNGRLSITKDVVHFVFEVKGCNSSELSINRARKMGDTFGLLCRVSCS
jgi:hypothetical protein